MKESKVMLRLQRVVAAERGTQLLEYATTTGLGFLLAGILIVSIGINRYAIGAVMAQVLDHSIASFTAGAEGAIDYDFSLEVGADPAQSSGASTTLHTNQGGNPVNDPCRSNGFPWQRSGCNGNAGQ
jgi:hypothetical protein